MSGEVACCHRQTGASPAACRPRLEDLFRDLNLIHDLMTVCGEAAKAPRSVCDIELSNVLQRVGADLLYTHLKTLTDIIERMGGSTDFTEFLENTTTETDHER
jgi:hypothetical protein